MASRDWKSYPTHYGYFVRGPAGVFLPPMRATRVHRDIRNLRLSEDPLLQQLCDPSMMESRVTANLVAPCATVLRFEDSGREMYFLPKRVAEELPRTEGKITMDDVVFPHQTFYIIFEDSPFKIWDPSSGNKGWRRVDGAYVETGLRLAEVATAAPGVLDSDLEGVLAAQEMMSIMLWSSPKLKNGVADPYDDHYFFKSFPRATGEDSIEKTLEAVTRHADAENMLGELNVARMAKGLPPYKPNRAQRAAMSLELEAALKETRKVVNAVIGACLIMQSEDTPVVFDGVKGLEESIQNVSRKKSSRKRAKAIKRVEREIDGLPLGRVRYIGARIERELREADAEQEPVEAQGPGDAGVTPIRHWVRPHGKWVRHGRMKGDDGEKVPHTQRPVRWVWVKGFWRGAEPTDGAVSLTVIGG